MFVRTLFSAILAGLLLPSLLPAQNAADTKPVPSATDSQSVTEEKSSPFLDSYRAALIAYKNGDYKTARAAAQEAQKLKANDAKLKLLEGRIALELGEFQNAEKLIKEGIAADPDYPLSYQYMGDVYLREHQYMSAIDSYQEFLRHKPKDPDGLLKLVYCHIGRKDLSAAGQTLLQLDQFNDIHPGYYFAKAAIATATGKPVEAEKNFQTVRTMYGNDTFALFMKTYLTVFPPSK